MEEDPKDINSPLLTKPFILKQFENLEKVVDGAQKRIDYDVANNEDLMKSIEVIERFLRRKRRVCYGGQAINALLPKSRKFYNEKYDVPDYDFFTPTMDTDVEEIISDLQKAGFEDVTKKLSVHDGTIKVYVNFIPVADCSEIHPSIFKTLQKRARVVDGILYCDENFLRMMMYLELSRPRGQVDRWKKVYERLLLLNSIYKVHKCDDDIIVSKDVSMADREAMIYFCIKHKRVVAGPEFINFLEDNKGFVKSESIVQAGGPLLFFSPQAKLDGEDLAAILSENGRVQVQDEITLIGELFNFVTIKRRGKPVALIFQQEACHSYLIMKVDGNELRIASPDLYLHLYYTLMLFGKKERAYFKTSLDCLIQKLHEVSQHSRDNPTHFVPAFALRCSGRQQGYASLLKARATRTNDIRKKNKDKAKARGKFTRKA